jgi:hypothetical protein
VLAALRLKAVLVRANGLTYRGILLGADEDEVYLKGELRYLALPMERITSIKSADARDHLDEHKSVAPEFYRDEDA